MDSHSRRLRGGGRAVCPGGASHQNCVYLSTAQRALDALDGHAAFGVNYAPSHFGYQGVDYLGFLDRFADRIDHVHMKDVRWADEPQTAGVFGGHLPFGHEDRYLDFRSIGRGKIDFEEIIRRLHRIGRAGPLSIEWEDSGMDCEHGAEEACGRVRAYVPIRHEKVEVPVELRVEEKQAKCKREAAGTANMGRSGAVHEKPLSLVSEDSNHLPGKVSHEEREVPRTVHHAHVNAPIPAPSRNRLSRLFLNDDPRLQAKPHED